MKLIASPFWGPKRPNSGIIAKLDFMLAVPPYNLRGVLLVMKYKSCLMNLQMIIVSVSMYERELLGLSHIDHE